MQANLQYPYPGIRAGGLFLVIVGIGIVAGGFAGERQMTTVFNVGFFAGFVLLALLGRRLVRPLGSLTRFQVFAMPAAIVLEAISITIVNHVFKADLAQGNLHRYVLFILLVVGIHFVVFAIPMGPLMLLAAALCIINATIGLLVPDVSVVCFWILDGLIKVGVGSAMLWVPGLSRYRATASQ
jgi:hypothetical protein